MAIGESSSMAAERPPGFEAKQFPAGMRVVAVDDDQICLAMLNKLLRKCEYKVSCFSNAVEAIKMIRQNKDEIDLVITDVHMPEIDGFKLLEIAGLELDLPVIMLSANDTKETVMKGVMHGACDYLIKPVRFEELSVIWKHVVRRRKSLEEFEEAMNFNNVTIGDDNAPAEDNAQADDNALTEDNAQTERRVTRSSNRARANAGKRRKDDSDEEDDSEGMEDDEKFTKKKARVVWSPDLHRKFVNAVSEIGVDKAVPKSILEKMNVEKLTRENVASHLQKYRLYLKRLNSNPQAIQVAFGSRNPLSIDLRSFERFKNFHAHGRYRPPVTSNSSVLQSSRFNITSGNSPSPSVMPNLPPSQSTQISGGTGFNNASSSNFTLANNLMNSNQMNLYKGVSDVSSSFPSTSNSSYWNNNNTNYMPMTIPSLASEPLPIAPFGYRMNNPPGHTASLMGPHFGSPPNLIGGNRNSVTVDRLQQAVSELNTSLSMPNPNALTGGLNNINCDLGPFFNSQANAPSAMNGGMRTGIVTGGMGTGIETVGIGAGNTSGIGIGINTGGTNVASGGMGTSGIASGNIGTGMMSCGIGMGVATSGVGMGMASSGMGTGTVSGGLGTGTVSDGVGNGTANGGVGMGNVSGGLETGTLSGGIELGPLSQGVGGFDMTNFDAANNVAGADHAGSSSFQGGDDDLSISGIDELLASLLKPGEGVDSMSFMDDFFD